MKSILLGTVLAITPLWASESEVTKEQQVLAPSCQVQAVMAHTVSGGRCWISDEVMIGIHSVDPLLIRCAKLNVVCRKDSTPE